MGFKVPASREETEVSLDMYSISCDISPNQPLFIKVEGELTLVRGEDDCKLTPENKALVQGQMMTYSESKGQKVGVV